MRILKFGGTSLANSKRFFKVINIIEKKIQIEQIAIVLSAPATITNYLTFTIQEKLTLKTNKNYICKIKLFFYNLIKYIALQQTNISYKKLKNQIDQELCVLHKLLKKVSLLNYCSDKLRAMILCRGEIISIAIMQEILKSRKHSVTLINPIEKLVANDNYLNSEVNIEQSAINIQKMYIPKENIILMAGFLAGTKKKEATLLGRNGSDYSASILAACCNANYCEIWTDVNGIYTCDPKLVPNAYLLKSITYQEALTMSYFGASVLHPKTIIPIFRYKIPCIIQNTFHPNTVGTIINEYGDNNFPIKGITHLNQILLLHITYKKHKNMKALYSRVQYCLSSNNIDILLITQSCSKKTITICSFEYNLRKIINYFNTEFAYELEKKYISTLKYTKNLSILSIVTSHENQKKHISFKMSNILHQLNVTVLEIFQKKSENNVCCVIYTQNINQIIQKIHSTLYSNVQIIELFIIGVGGVGQQLIEQIKKQKKILDKKLIQIKICGIGNSKLLLTDMNGIGLDNWLVTLKNKGKSCSNINMLLKIIKKNILYNPVIVDCTSNAKIAYEYSNFIAYGCHVVTPNKKANTTNLQYYKKIRKNSFLYNKKFLYETNIGAGLPVIENLQKLLLSGDKLIKFKGILSGSLSFIFGKLDEGFLLSQATLEAKKLGFTEPNPIDDLSGMDVARKLLILAREVGFKINLDDIEIESIFPKNFQIKQINNNLIQQLSLLDEMFKNRIKIANLSGKVLRFVGSITNDGTCKVQIENIDIKDPLYTVKNGENALTFYTKYYTPIPLVLRGYGAGNTVTAAGVFSDILRIL